MEERDRLNKLIDAAYTSLENETDLDAAMQQLAYLDKMLNMRKTHYDTTVEESKRREGELLLEKIETERRQRVLMEERHKVEKQCSYINAGTNIVKTAIDGASKGVELGLKNHQFNVVQNNEGFGTYTTIAGKKQARDCVF